MRERKSMELAACAVLGYMLVRCCLLLQQGTVAERFMVAGLFLLYVAVGLFLLFREGVPRRRLIPMTVVFCGAMLVRVLCFDYISGDYTAHLSKWYAFFRDNGGFAAIRESVGDYNVPYLYFMAAISYFDLPDLYMIKLFSVLFDVLLAWGVYRLVNTIKWGSVEVPLVAFAVVLFLPTVVVNSAYWGQCDAIYGALCVHAVNELLGGEKKRSVALIALAFSFKLQTVFIMPIWGVMWAAGKIRFRDLLWFPITYLAVVFPALLMGKPLWDTLLVYTNQMTEYPALTLNAPSVYQLIPYGAQVDEPMLACLGIVAAGVLALGMLCLGRWLRSRMNREILMAMMAVLVIGVPFLLPHMHERYFFLADILAVCWACCNRRYVPMAVLTCSASLCSYFVFLNCAFHRVLYIGARVYVMRVETDLMLMAFIGALSMLFAVAFEGRRGRRPLRCMIVRRKNPM